MARRLDLQPLTDDPFILFCDAAKSYDGRNLALQPLNLGVAKGEFLTFLGPSGSGKTTTLMILAGFEAPSAGDVLMNSRSIRALPPERRGIGMVFQNYALFPHLTVAENVAFPLVVRRLPRAEIAERVRLALGMVQLNGLGDRRPAQISGGQQQRVAVARALVFQPEIVLLDEPLGALDRQLREQMQTELRSIHDRLGVTMIYVTHDQAEAMTMSDRVAIFHQGGLRQVAPPDALYDAPDSVFVAQFLGETNTIAGRVIEASGGGCRVEVDGGACVVATAVGTCPPGSAVTLTVRPERVALGEEAACRANCFEGQAVGITFLGDQLRSRWALFGQQDFTVKVPNSKRHGLPPVGTPAWIGWDAADCRAIPS